MTSSAFYMFYSSFQEGHIDLLSSDHSPTVPQLKLLEEGDFLKAWGGVTSLQVNEFSYSEVRPSFLWEVFPSLLK